MDGMAEFIEINPMGIQQPRVHDVRLAAKVPTNHME